MINEEDHSKHPYESELEENETIVFYPVDEYGNPIPSKVPIPRIVNLHYLSGFEIMMMAFNFVVMASTIPYFSIVSLNVVFTNKFLTTSDIPCYDPTLFEGLGSFWSDQLFPDWWINLSDFLYIVTPVFQMWIMLEANLSGGDDRKDANYWYLGVTLFIKFVTAAARGYQAIFCFYFNLCRACPGECTSSTNCMPNEGFTYALVYNVLYLVVILLYMIITISGLYRDSVTEYLTDQYDNLRLLSYGHIFIQGEVDELKAYIPPRLLMVGGKFDRYSRKLSGFTSKIERGYRFGLGQKFSGNPVL